MIGKIDSKEKPIPLELVRYLIGTLNYGGRITKKQDETTLNAILSTFICEKTMTEAYYKLTGIASKDTGIYYVPGDGDL